MAGSLTANTPAFKDTAEGAGPRHIAFHPSGAFAYVINENDSTLSAYRVTAQGLLEDIESASTLPPGYTDPNTGAHVLVHPNGKHVYASNRGHDSIAVFAIDAADGSLTFVEHEPSRGNTPRNFDIDSTGELMVVANQDTGSLAVFRIASDGTLAPLGELVTGLPQPNAVAIVNVTAP